MPSKQTPKRGRPPKFSGDAIKDLKTVVGAGMTLDEVGSVCGTSTVAVRNALLKASYQFRSRGPRTGVKAGFRNLGFAPTKVGDNWVLRTPTGFTTFETRTEAKTAAKDLRVSPAEAAKALARLRHVAE